jgi:parvulin-like peptidyl-prolyl isomerase
LFYIPFGSILYERKPEEEKMDLRKVLLIACISFLAPLAMAEELDPVVGRAGDYVLRKSSLGGLVEVLPKERQRQLKANPQPKVAIVRAILTAKVIADEARKEGFDQQKEIKEQVQLMVNDYLTRQYLEKKVLKGVVVTEEEMKTYYTANEKQFTVPEQVRARHLLIRVSPKASESDRRKAREKAEDLLKKIKGGEDFGKLAEKFSDDQGSKKKQGDLGYFTRGRMMKALEELVFSLKPGEVSEVAETPVGFHLIKMEDRRPGGTRSFEEVKDRIGPQLRSGKERAKMEEFTKKVEEEAGLEVYPEKINGEEQKE